VPIPNCCTRSGPWHDSDNRGGGTISAVLWGNNRCRARRSHDRLWPLSDLDDAKLSRCIIAKGPLFREENRSGTPFPAAARVQRAAKPRSRRVGRLAAAASFDPSLEHRRCREDIGSRIRLMLRNGEALPRTG